MSLDGLESGGGRQRALCVPRCWAGERRPPNNSFSPRIPLDRAEEEEEGEEERMEGGGAGGVKERKRERREEGRAGKGREELMAFLQVLFGVWTAAEDAEDEAQRKATKGCGTVQAAGGVFSALRRPPPPPPAPPPPH